MKRVHSTILHSVSLATLLGSSFATQAAAQEHHDERRDEHEHHDVHHGPAREPQHEGPDRDEWRREHARRVVVDRDHDLDRYRQHYVNRPGWRTYGVYLGLPAPLAANPNLAWLADTGTLVGSYQQYGHVVYLYVYDDDLGNRHQIEVRDDGRIVADAILPNVPGFGY
jgi:Ni/Co efflux regulator RcnB